VIISKNKCYIKTHRLKNIIFCVFKGRLLSFVCCVLRGNPYKDSIAKCQFTLKTWFSENQEVDFETNAAFNFLQMLTPKISWVFFTKLCNFFLSWKNQFLKKFEYENLRK
jgi:hypothetical protein